MATKKARFVRAFLVHGEESVSYSSFWSYIFLAPYAAPAAMSNATPGRGVGANEGLFGCAHRPNEEQIAQMRIRFFILFVGLVKNNLGGPVAELKQVNTIIQPRDIQLHPLGAC